MTQQFGARRRNDLRIPLTTPLRILVLNMSSVKSATHVVADDICFLLSYISRCTFVHIQGVSACSRGKSGSDSLHVRAPPVGGSERRYRIRNRTCGIEDSGFLALSL